ncbi:hypothetical protein D3C81_1715110 [compost metagenome]
MYSGGQALNTSPRPRPTASTITMKPTLIPMAWGMERRTPKLTPEASSMVLLGPGVMEETKANSTKAVSRSAEASMAGIPHSLWVLSH